MNIYCQSSALPGDNSCHFRSWPTRNNGQIVAFSANRNWLYGLVMTMNGGRAIATDCLTEPGSSGRYRRIPCTYCFEQSSSMTAIICACRWPPKFDIKFWAISQMLPPEMGFFNLVMPLHCQCHAMGKGSPGPHITIIIKSHERTLETRGMHTLGIELIYGSCVVGKLW